MTHEERQKAIHQYAVAQCDNEGDHQAKVFAGASVAMMRSLAQYMQAHELADRAAVWCDMRRIKYATIEEAVRIYRAQS